MGANDSMWWRNPDLDSLDRRTRKTKEALFSALVGLLGRKPLDAISVTELTRAADVNRSTFYTHYQGIYDIYEELLAVGRTSVDRIAAEQRDSLRAGNYLPLITETLTFFRENRQVFKLLFDDSSAFMGGVTDIIREHYMAVLSYAEDGYSPDEVRRMRYGVEFSIDGAVGVLRMWIQGGCVEDMGDIANLICSMMAAARDAAIARCTAGA